MSLKSDFFNIVHQVGHSHTHTRSHTLSLNYHHHHTTMLLQSSPHYRVVIAISNITHLRQIYFQGFRLDLLEPDSSRFVGSAYVMPLRHGVSQCVGRVPIIGLKSRPIGEVNGEVTSLLMPLLVLSTLICC